MRRKKIKIGDKYGKLTVESKNYDKSMVRYECQCKCGGMRTTYAYYLLDNPNPNCGCETSRFNKPINSQFIIRQRFGELTALEIDESYTGKGIKIICRCDCGNIVSIHASHLKRGYANSCGHTLKNNRRAGTNKIMSGRIEGTNIYSIAPDRKINKNNSTGVNGVSYIKKIGKYRAYLHFKKKYYFIGDFDNIEDAKEARKTAEEKIFGEFLKSHTN